MLDVSFLFKYVQLQLRVLWNLLVWSIAACVATCGAACVASCVAARVASPLKLPHALPLALRYRLHYRLRYRLRCVTASVAARVALPFALLLELPLALPLVLFCRHLFVLLSQFNFPQKEVNDKVDCFLSFRFAKGYWNSCKVSLGLFCFDIFLFLGL